MTKGHTSTEVFGHARGMVLKTLAFNGYDFICLVTFPEFILVLITRLGFLFASF